MAALMCVCSLDSSCTQSTHKSLKYMISCLSVCFGTVFAVVSLSLLDAKQHCQAGKGRELSALLHWQMPDLLSVPCQCPAHPRQHTLCQTQHSCHAGQMRPGPRSCNDHVCNLRQLMIDVKPSQFESPHATPI